MGMGKEEVLRILDEVRRVHRGSLTESVISRMKGVVEDAYQAAEECRTKDALDKVYSFGNLHGQYIAELPPEKTGIAGKLVNARWKMVEDIADILEKKCGLRGRRV
jgi:hypothetical protein